MRKHKIFAPCDGVVKPLSENKDQTFAQLILGDGFFIEPTGGSINSLFDTGTVNLVFDTKHALYLERTEGVNVLVHVGLETVKLQGLPFTDVIATKSKINKNTKLMNVDWELLEKEKIDNSVICAFNTIENEHLKIEITKFNQEVKQGDLIGFLILEKHKQLKIKKSKDNKWTKVVPTILEAVGPTNYESYYNCMTRLRFKVKDKNIVNTDAIKKNELVKGINWAGDELQIIIGGEVYKAKQEMDFLIKGKPKEVKKSKGKVVISFISGVMIPTLPVLMGAGILAGIQALFVQIGWIKNPGSVETQLDIFSMIMFVSAKVGIELVGVIFCYNTVRYLGGNPVMAIFLALALTSRHLLGPGFGDAAGFWQHDGKGFRLFQLFGNWVYVKGYESTIIPMITGGIFIYYFDKWVQRWMPGAVDIVFRPAIVFFFSFVIILFLIGPITGIIEQLLGQGIIKMGTLPGGIGVGVFCGLWELLVLTGTHVAIANAVKLPIMTGAGSSAMAAGFGIAILAQMGACMGVMLKTKNIKLRQVCLGTVPSILFGISEPTLYSVNVPKVRPLFMGCIGAFVGGIISGVLKVDADVLGGGGVLQFMWFLDGWKEIVFWGLAVFSAIAIACVLTYFTYQERLTEPKGIKNLEKRIKIFLVTRKVISAKLFNEKFGQEFKEFYEEVKKDKKIWNDLENVILIRLTIEEKIKKLNEKIDSAKNEKTIERYQNKISSLTPKNEENNLKINAFTKTIEELNQNFIQKINKILDQDAEILANDDILKFKEMYENVFNSVFINYELKTKLPEQITKQEIYQTKNKLKLLVLK